MRFIIITISLLLTACAANLTKVNSILSPLIDRGEAIRGYYTQARDADDIAIQETIKDINNWRAEVAETLSLDPFNPVTRVYVLTTFGNLIDAELIYLRDVMKNPHRWLK